MKRLISLFFTVIFIGSCNREELPKAVLPEDKMVALLTDIHIIDGYTSSVVVDTMKKYAPAFYHSAFKKYHTDSARFSASLKYYSLKPDVLLKMYEKVQSNMDRVQKNEQKRRDIDIKRKFKKPIS